MENKVIRLILSSKKLDCGKLAAFVKAKPDEVYPKGKASDKSPIPEKSNIVIFYSKINSSDWEDHIKYFVKNFSKKIVKARKKGSVDAEISFVRYPGSVRPTGNFSVKTLSSLYKNRISLDIDIY